MKTEITEMREYAESWLDSGIEYSRGQIIEAMVNKARALESSQAEKDKGLVETVQGIMQNALNGGHTMKECEMLKKYLGEILSCYTSSYSDKPAKDLQGQHAQMVALAKAHGLDIAADWAVKMSGKTFSEETTPSSSDEGLREELRKVSPLLERDFVIALAIPYMKQAQNGYTAEGAAVAFVDALSRYRPAPKDRYAELVKRLRGVVNNIYTGNQDADQAWGCAINEAIEELSKDADKEGR